MLQKILTSPNLGLQSLVMKKKTKSKAYETEKH